MDLDINKILDPSLQNGLDEILIEHCASLSVDSTPIKKLSGSMKGWLY